MKVIDSLVMKKEATGNKWRSASSCDDSQVRKVIYASTALFANKRIDNVVMESVVT